MDANYHYRYTPLHRENRGQAKKHPLSVNHGPNKKKEEESFQPISVKPTLFKLRCIVDLQLATIAKHLRPALSGLTGRVLDVGAGQSPWCAWLPASTTYQGIDIANADNFGMSHRQDIIYYDGRVMPFPDASFDSAICIEVLEHSEDPLFLIREVARILKPEGTLLLTVPWSARRHHILHDYHRFTRERLRTLFTQGGFSVEEIIERGSDIGVIANKLMVLTIRLFRPKWMISFLWTIPAGLLCAAMTSIFVVAAHCSDALGMGSKEDPLGYFVRARRRDA